MNQKTNTPILAPKDVRSARKSVCDSCEFKHQTVPVCTQCKCVIIAKVMLASAECPKDKWTA